MFKGKTLDLVDLTILPINALNFCLPILVLVSLRRVYKRPAVLVRRRNRESIYRDIERKYKFFWLKICRVLYVPVPYPGTHDVKHPSTCCICQQSFILLEIKLPSIILLIMSRFFAFFYPKIITKPTNYNNVIHH